MRSTLVTLTLGLCAVWSCGCGGDGGGRPERKSLSPADYFNQTQGNTVTPHGRIKADSAESAGDGKLRYETEDGKRWEVTATPEGKGYRYSSPQAAKERPR